MCKHFIQGNCPFGDSCHFAHGQDELHRHKMMKNNSNTSTFDESGEIRSNLFRVGRAADQEYYEGDPVKGGKANPITEITDAEFFIVAAQTYADLCKSVATSTLPSTPALSSDIRSALSSGKKVMLFFTVPDSKHIQGAALATASSEAQVRAWFWGTNERS